MTWKQNIGDLEREGMSAEEVKYVFFVLGGPGAGKGTQCAKLKEKYPITHLSAGELLRGEMAREGSEYGALISDLIKNGKIVPSKITTQLLLNAIKENKNKVFLIDGFPRNEENKQVWNELADPKIFDVVSCISFEVSLETLKKRIAIRAKTSGRSDDNAESLLKRFDTFEKETMPIIKYYESINKLNRYSGEESIDEVFAKVDETFKKFFDDHHIPY